MPAAGDRHQVAQQRDGLRLQRHDVRLTVVLPLLGAFHALARDGPQRIVQVDLAPGRAP